MLRGLFTPMTLALLSGGLLLPSLRADGSNNTTGMTAAKSTAPVARTKELRPFNHFAYIPAGADLNTIRFEKVRMVKVPTSIKYTSDPNRCEALTFGDPGGSMDCPDTRTEATVPAYEAIYSFIGQPLASDERADRNFTFSVYFRTDELPADIRKALSDKKLSRSDTAAYFAVNTRRESVRRVAIDEKQSHFCEADLIDGLWTRSDPGCKDSISYIAVTAPSGNITVEVQPATLQSERAAK